MQHAGKAILNGKRAIDWSKVILIALILVMCIITTLVNKRFATINNLLTIAKQISSPGILAMGMTFVILTGGIDLSAGYGITLCAIVMGLIFNATGNPWLTMVGAIGAGCILGITNGLIITRLRVIPFITTLATMSITQGVLNVIALGSKFFLKDPVYTAIAAGGVMGSQFPISVAVFLVVFILCQLILKLTTLGRYVYAIGSSEKNTKLAGINTKHYKTLVYVLSGLCMGVASIIMASRISQITQESGGNTYLMDAIAAVIIGGTPTEGGRGDMVGTLLGVILLGVISSLLVFLSIPTIGQQCFKGIVIIVALLLNRISKVLKEKQEIEEKSRVFLGTRDRSSVGA